MSKFGEKKDNFWTTLRNPEENSNLKEKAGENNKIIIHWHLNGTRNKQIWSYQQWDCSRCNLPGADLWNSHVELHNQSIFRSTLEFLNGYLYWT